MARKLEGSNTILHAVEELMNHFEAQAQSMTRKDRALLDLVSKGISEEQLTDLSNSAEPKTQEERLPLKARVQ